MITSLNYFILFFLASLPINTILRWILPQSQPETTPHVKSGSSILRFCFIHLFNFSLGFVTTILANQFFFYEISSFFTIAISIILVSFFWSVFNKFKSAGNIIPFILGILSFYSIHFIWLFSLFALLFIIIFNHVTIGVFIALLALYSGLTIFDISTEFITIHTLIVVMYILRKNNKILDFFSKNPKTLLMQFQQRNL